MTEDTFHHNMDMLIAGIVPFRFGEKNKAAYWKVFHPYTDDQFTSACNKLLTTIDDGKFPSIPRLMAELKPLSTKHHEGCGNCEGGRVRYTYKHDNGQMYDRYCACDVCEAGEYIANMIYNMARSRARNNNAMLPSGSPENYKVREVKFKLGDKYLPEITPTAVVGEWDRVPDGSQTPTNAFLDTITKKIPMDLGEEKQFDKEDIWDR